MKRSSVVLMSLFAVFLVSATAWLASVPGLLGDEGSEGENIYELWSGSKPFIYGERSYIGPAIDYVRMPFVWLFGSTALALRIVTLLFSIATFWLAWWVLRKHFGDGVGLFALVALVLSPAFILYQRIGWAITLFPFFLFLLLFLLHWPWRLHWLLVGVVAGLGLSNHIIFTPVLPALAAGIGVAALPRLRKEPRTVIVGGLNMWPVVLGFVVAFGLQFYVLSTWQEDQGNPSESVLQFSERVQSLPTTLPLYLSGSSFIARYTGGELGPDIQRIITGGLFLLVTIGGWYRRQSVVWWAWVVGIVVHLLALMYVVDRFTLRYFVMTALGVWLLAGVGIGELATRLLRKPLLVQVTAVLLSVVLVGWMALAVLVPFLLTDGSTNEFPLGDRTNRAAAFADVRPLLKCVSGLDGVYTENVHIWNRLRYLSHSRRGVSVLDEAEADQVQWLVHYRFIDGSSNDCAVPGERCPEMRHFCVVPVE